ETRAPSPRAHMAAHLTRQFRCRYVARPQKLYGPCDMITVGSCRHVDPAHRDPVADEPVDWLAVLEPSNDYLAAPADDLHRLDHGDRRGRRRIDDNVETYAFGEAAGGFDQVLGGDVDRGVRAQP